MTVIDRYRANLIDKMMQNLIYEDKLKRNEQNIWDTSVQYNKTHPFQNAIEHGVFEEQKYAYKARVKHVCDEDKPSLATAMKLPDWPRNCETVSCYKSCTYR